MWTQLLYSTGEDSHFVQLMQELCVSFTSDESVGKSSKLEVGRIGEPGDTRHAETSSVEHSVQSVPAAVFVGLLFVSSVFCLKVVHDFPLGDAFLHQKERVIYIQEPKVSWGLQMVNILLHGVTHMFCVTEKFSYSSHYVTLDSSGISGHYHVVKYGNTGHIFVLTEISGLS